VIIDNNKNVPNYFFQDLKDMGLDVFLLPHRNTWSHLRNIRKVISLIRKHEVDIVHTSLPFGNIVVQMSAKLSGTKHRITTCENASWAHDFGHKKQERIDKLTFRLAKKVIAVADSAKEYLQEHYHLNGQKLITIYHGLKESEYENISEKRIISLKNQYGISEQDFVIGVIARYEFWKGHEFINKAAAILKQRNQHQGLKILIFGSKGSYFETAKQQVKESGIENVVVYKGYCNDPVALFKVMDIHLHVPVNKYVENCGINIIEGMISAVPQILTKSGYAWQSANHLNNAYVVNYKNADEIADAIVYLRNNVEKARQLGQKAKSDALSTYGQKIKTEKHFQLYTDLLNGKMR
jgi:glycosyltransferase involved in cell wall biosynthesis